MQQWVYEIGTLVISLAAFGFTIYKTRATARKDDVDKSYSRLSDEYERMFNALKEIKQKQKDCEEEKDILHKKLEETRKEWNSERILLYKRLLKLENGNNK